jgi:hypothetical protein
MQSRMLMTFYGPPLTVHSGLARYAKSGGVYIILFSAVRKGPRGDEEPRQIGFACATSAQGPYVDTIGAPLVTDDCKGVIDPSLLVLDSGDTYLYWKYNGNQTYPGGSPEEPTRIIGQQISFGSAQNGSIAPALLGEAVDLLVNDKTTWEGDYIEAPFVVQHNGLFYLLYSGDCSDIPNTRPYAVGYAVSEAPLGPFVKWPAPILRPIAEAPGPGSCSVVDGGSGRAVCLYHAFPGGNGPFLYVDELRWADNRIPAFKGAVPNVSEQPSVVGAGGLSRSIATAPLSDGRPQIITPGSDGGFSVSLSAELSVT